MDKYLNSKQTAALIQAFRSLKTVDEGRRFLRDLCTPQEIKDLGERLEIASLLLAGKTYREISSELNISTTTVTRVAQWLNNGMNGYKAVLTRNSHHHTTKPDLGKGVR